MMQIRPIMIMAGGTGGHVFPALAVAEELREQGVPVVWLGTRAGIEARLVPAAGYPVEWINIGGLRGKSFVSRLLAPVKIISACVQATKILLRIKPCAVLGMGGFVSGPGGVMAWLLRKPLLIHEQNAVPGLTNKILSAFATQLLQAFPAALKKPAVKVGNPVRRSITQLPLPEQRYPSHQDSLRLLVIGGSLGAVRLNEVVPAAVALLEQDVRPQIIHQTGTANLQQAEQHYASKNVQADVRAFIDDMDEAYAWADIVVCRAGAMTVFELAATGVASILVPYPHAVDDHQTANADYLASAGAAIVRQQHELTAEWLSETLLQFNAQRDGLLQMAKRARELAMPNAANDVAQYCMAAGGIH
jgi:UDP-N-acetylglucosamine--N-acetylmuramyl-(pentapeptide) pyrophosphoryl-undecaprenol N-acetylglucosamine transferase